MITLKTTYSADSIRIDRIAESLAKFFPDYEHYKNHLPYPIGPLHEVYVIDAHNDFRCALDEEDPTLVQINHRSNRAMERAFAEWVAARMRWEVQSGHAERTTRASVDVRVDLAVPGVHSQEELNDVTLHLPTENAVVFIAGKQVHGAKIICCTTTTETEVVS